MSVLDHIADPMANAGHRYVLALWLGDLQRRLGLSTRNLCFWLSRSDHAAIQSGDWISALLAGLGACPEPVEEELTLPAFEAIAEATAERIRRYLLSAASREQYERLRNRPRHWQGREISAVFVGEAAYPRYLLWLNNAPALLYVQGERWRCALEQNYLITVVGSRRPTVYGKEQTRLLCRNLAKYGATVISGQALGIDAIAHQTALEVGAPTVAILPCGLLHNYPERHNRLRMDILAGGAVASELAPDQAVHRRQFASRNRLLSGMGQATLVVEAGEDSGSLITANHAGVQGRSVFAVPGNVTSDVSRGCNRLIQDGASICLAAEDILTELSPNGERFRSENLSLIAAERRRRRASRRLSERAEREKEAKIMPLEQLSREVAGERSPGELPVEKQTALPEEIALAEQSALAKEILRQLSAQTLTAEEIGGALDLDFRDVVKELSRLEIAGLLSFERGRYTCTAALADTRT
ncbi:MAG: DNA-protecting protein DprA [Clostridiaceae bacterium]|mgnify:CR=1 FL=1|nr:DNA-protecting protein DprA [Clostridiaceae bacterium]